MASSSTTNDILIPRERTEDEALALFKAVEEKFPSETLGSDKWYVVVLAAMTGGGHPHFAAQLYQELIKRPEYQTPAQRQELMRRLREVLFKLTILVGVCKTLEALFAITAVTKPEDEDHSYYREKTQCDEANLERGTAWLQRLYQRNLTGVMNRFTAHKDYEWMTNHITYGIFLSDQRILNDIETELTVVSGIMIQNLSRESLWHMRGFRRLGPSQEDLGKVRECVSRHPISNLYS
ncbi:hypothetical protein ACJQWK_07345 [Exserohilum turcicum]